MQTEIRLEHIQIARLKSSSLDDLSSVEITRSGAKLDRKLMIARNNNHFLSQRQAPGMTQLSTREVDGKIIISHPDMNDDLVVSLEAPDKKSISVIMHDEERPINVIPIEGKASDWLSQAVGKNNWNPLKLVIEDPNFTRLTDSDFIVGEQEKFSLTDAGPFTLHSLESEEALNEALDRADMPRINRKRFRSTLVFSGFEKPWDEMGFSIGKLTRSGNSENPQPSFKLVRPVPRCPIPKINPETGETDLGKGFVTNVLPSLNEEFGLGRKYLFGEYAVLNSGEEEAFILHQGDKFIFETE